MSKTILCFYDGKFLRGERLFVVDRGWEFNDHGVMYVRAIKEGWYDDGAFSLYRHPTRDGCWFNWDHNCWYYEELDTSANLKSSIELGYGLEYLHKIYPDSYFEALEDT